MKTENGHIIEATREELYSLWQYYEIYDLMTFQEYLEHFRRLGVNILNDKESS